MTYHYLKKIVNLVKSSKRSPDFENGRSVLQRQIPSRPTQFEFILNNKIYQQVTGRPVPEDGNGASWCPYVVETFTKLGYDYAAIGGWQLKALVFPWYKKIVDMAHEAGKPVILHSCGNTEAIMDDIIDGLKFDGKHSFEDAIVPVEKAIELWSDTIAILGGIDVDFLASRSTEKIQKRTNAIINQCKKEESP